MRRPLVVGALAIVIVLVSASASAGGGSHGTSGFQETDLVSDVAGRAALTDSLLVNPWGIVATGGDLRIANNGSGFSTLFSGSGAPLTPTIWIPGGVPTGLIVNELTSAFKAKSGDKSGHSRFIFAGEDGTISAWSPEVNPDSAIQMASTPEAVYKGIAEGTTKHGTFLYATNFHTGKVDVFDQHFAPVAWDSAFVDTALDAGYAPFGILNSGGKLIITFAKQKGDLHDDQPGAGFGFVDVFSTGGRLLKRLVSHGVLNAPWGLAVAPSGFGNLGGALLVGNFGDGRINAFDPSTGDSVGFVADTSGVPITIEGLWGLAFGNGSGGGGDGGDDEDDDAARGAQPEHDGDNGHGNGHGDDNGHGHGDGHGGDDGHGHGDEHHGGPTLYFTAGISDENHGLFGSLTPAQGQAKHPRDDDRANRGRNSQALQVTVLRGNPVRLSDPAGVQWNVSSTVPDVLSLKIYDASGRRVAEPLRNLPFSGAIVASWDMRDSHGTKVPAGIYFYHGTTATGVANGRLVLLH